MASGDYTIDNIYESGYSSFTPSSKDSPYLNKQNLIPANQMGMTVNPMVADQLSELSRMLNVGTKNIEVGAMDFKTFETIPKHHWEEMRRKAKLAGMESLDSKKSDARVTLHAPIQDMDPSGFGKRGWDETKRELVEKQLKDTMDRAAVLDSTGNLPVTIHGSNTEGSTFKMVDGEKKYDTLAAVNKATGEIMPIKESTQFQPGMSGEDWKTGSTMDPMTALRSHNSTSWRKEVDQVLFEKESADKIISDVYPVAKDVYNEVRSDPNKFNQLPQSQKELVLNLQTANAHIHQAELNVTSVFDKAYQYVSDDKEKKQYMKKDGTYEYVKKTAEEKKEDLKEIADEYDRALHGGYTTKEYDDIRKRAVGGKLKKGDEEAYHKIMVAQSDLAGQSHAIQNFAEKLRNHNPEMVTSVEDFAKEKASETFANVALHSYKKYGEGAPVVSIENLYQGMGFSQSKDLNELVEKSQQAFVEKVVKEKKLSEQKAKEVAEKLIGVTFDVGHLNVSRAHGFEEKHLVQEAKEIAKNVKHVHITDNFGYEDVHLPIGMGNVPVQALMEALGEKGAKAIKINEIGGWAQHFKTNPFPQILEAAGSQIYSSSNGPHWSQIGGFQQSYLEGYGQMLPQTHYQTFGAGFSQLPQDLGGQLGQAGGGRMGGGGF